MLSAVGRAEESRAWMKRGNEAVIKEVGACLVRWVRNWLVLLTGSDGHLCTRQGKNRIICSATSTAQPLNLRHVKVMVKLA